MKQKTVEHYPDYWNKYVSDDKYEAKVISELRGLEKLTLPLNTFLNKNKIPKNESYVYKISVGGKDYIGCTNKYYFENEEHRFHNLAKTNSKHPLCVALRRYGFVSKCILISKHNDEVTALLAQISEIEKLKPKLNETIGGEGVNYNIIEQYDENGELILFIEDKLKIKKYKKNMQDYLKKLVVKIYNRYLKVVSKYDSYKIDYLLPNPYPMFDINKPILDRKLVSLLAFEFKNRCERILNWNETEEKKHFKEIGFEVKHKDLKFLEVDTDEIHYLFDKFDLENYEDFLIDTKRLIKLPLLKKGKVADTFSNKLEAIKIIKCSDWFIEGQEKEIFKSGDVFYPVVIETGTIVTGSFFNRKVEKKLTRKAIKLIEVSKF